MTRKSFNIALLIDSKSYGGIETHVVNLAKGLNNKGHQVSIVLLNNYGYHPVFEQESFIRSILIKQTGTLTELFKFLKTSNFNLIHTHGYKAGIQGRLICKLINKPVVSTFHSGEQGNFKIRFYRWLDRVTARNFPCICISKQLKKTLDLSADVIENFVEPPVNGNIDNTSASQIAFVGRFSYEKGPDRFLRIAQQLPQFSFEMYGDGPMLENIEKQSPTYVSLKGHIHSMGVHWKKIKLLCITSREEGLPLVALEALVRGIPVISYDIGGISAVVKNNKSGWLIPAFEEASFIQAIKISQSQSVKERKEMSSFATNYIKDHFSTKVLTPKIFNVYYKAMLGEVNVY